MKIIRPPVKYHGGKYYLCRWIIQNFPSHKTYVEPFGGAASVLLNKQRAEIEVYNDFEHSISNLMKVLRDSGPEMLAELRALKYEKDQYLALRERFRSDDFTSLPSLEKAVITYSVRRMSRGGTGGTFCWSDRIYGDGVPGEVHGWLTSLDQLPLVIERLQGVNIHNTSYSDMIDMYDGEETLFYFDPPYPKETRVAKKVYLKEMSTEDHEAMAERLLKVKGKVVLSSYRSSLYDKYFGSWRQEYVDIPNHSSHEKTKEKKQEVIWMNY